MKKKLLAGLAVGVMMLGMSGIGDAAPITSSSQLSGTTSVIDFSQFTGANQYTGVNGPVQIGSDIGMDVTASAQNGSLYLYDSSWGLWNNGSWDSGRQGYLGVWPMDGPVTINFNLTELLSGFGAFMNYIDGGQYSSIISISAYDGSNNLLETYNVLNDPISTPNGINDGAFRGILRNTADIASIQFYGLGIVLDDLTFQADAAPVPEPATMLLFGTGLAGLVGARLRRKK
jgi:hypothetical protein